MALSSRTMTSKSSSRPRPWMTARLTARSSQVNDRKAARRERQLKAETSAAEGPLRGRLGGRSADQRSTIERERFKSTHDGLSTLHETVTWQKRWTPPVGTHDNDSRTPTGNW